MDDDGDESTEISKDDLMKMIGRVFWAYLIPTAWGASGQSAFILDAGTDCAANDHLSPRYLYDYHAHLSYACYSDKLYYLAAPKGLAMYFHPGNTGTPPTWKELPFDFPDGIKELGGSDWGNLTRDDIIIGYARLFLFDLLTSP